MMDAVQQKQYEDQIKELTSQLESYKRSGTDVESYLDPTKKGTINLTGTPEEKEGQMSGLNLAKLAYGQNLAQTGEDVQRIRQQLLDRASLASTDPITAAIMGQKASAMAGAQRSLQSSGVKGGVAAGAADAIGRQRDSDIAASLYGQQRQSLSDLRALTGNTLSGSVALMQGAKGEAVKMPEAPSTQGLTVICTELYRQGIMEEHIYVKDIEYGRRLAPEVLNGYHFWAIPIVNLMKKSSIFTKIVTPFAMSWARHIAGEKKSAFGYLCQVFGEPLCGVIGSILKLRKKYV